MKNSHSKASIGSSLAAGALSTILAFGGMPLALAFAEEANAEQQAEEDSERQAAKNIEEDEAEENTEQQGAPESTFESTEPQVQVQSEVGLEAQASTESVNYIKASVDDGALSYEAVEGQECTVVTSGDVSWGEAGTETWYVVSGEVEISEQRVTCAGTVNLVLEDGAKLTVSQGITTTGAVLNIYGQGEGTGELISTGKERWAGIGGVDFGAGGELNIHGGTITANGGMYNGDGGAGIGGGAYGDGGKVTIFGGTVTATGKAGGAGIGGGIYMHGGNGAEVAIYGGEVIANGDFNAEGIGKGYDLSGNAKSNSLTLGDRVAMQISNDNKTWSDYDPSTDVRAQYMRTVAQGAQIIPSIRPIVFTPTVSCLAHLRTTGDVEGVSSTESFVGTTGESRRLEGMSLTLDNESGYEGGIRYMVHMRTLGWSQGWKADGDFAGTRGESRRAEAMRVELTGDLAEHYDVWYRVHVRAIGWMGWARNGEGAGTTGQSRRMEAYQIVVMPKGSAAPGSTANAFQGKL